MKKSVVIAICLMLLGTSRADAISNWAQKEAQTANIRGLVTESLLWGGITENITREEFCYLAMNLYKNMGGEAVKLKENPFTDTNNQAVITAYSLGIINGKTKDTFEPQEPVTRQEISKVIMLTLNALGDDDVTQREICEICNFEDFEEIHPWATEYMEDAVRFDIINGVSKTKLLPLGNATREQAILIMNRAYEKFSKEIKEYTYPEINLALQGNTLSVSWSRTDGAKEYSVILRDRDNNVIKKETVNGTYWEMSAEELGYGQYSVLVGAHVGDFAYVYSPAESLTIYPEEYVEKYPTDSDKYNRIFGGGEAYTDYETARANIKTITVPVWKLDENGNKYSSRLDVEVNVNLAEDILRIFTEIYNHPERFPIKNLGGFSWRQTAFGGISEHSYGTCIDINWDENYYCYASTGEAITGSFWKPYENPYSIPKDGSVVQIFKKYGFKWGGDAWTSMRDYMHFTYLGR